ncbi:YfhO family protein [Fructobacillus ficulneus]|nr:YfhO family protein [Fructobacillus ficulneus]
MKRLHNLFLSPVSLTFWLPIIIMTFYFAGREMMPFGSSTILTVDLGQQYLDYFVQFKHTLLSDPSSFFYSFSSGLGGNMLGEWSYYLMSPFNLIFLLATPKSIPAWILLVTVLKLGFAGFSMAWLIKKMNWQQGYWITIFAINYPLSAWFIANDLNLLWLDTAALLPLLILALERLLAGKGWGAFTLALVGVILTNYYIAWMIGLFLLMYLPWRFLDPMTKHHRGHLLFNFIKGGLVSVLLTAWLWLPTYAQLKAGKTTHNSSWSLHFDNNPLLLFLKLIPGSFDFDQLKFGQANFLVAPIVIIALWGYFTSKKFKWTERTFAFLIVAILFLATCFAPLTLLFHGGQYPVWYPARFSFIISFFFILLAAKSYHVEWKPGIFTRILFLAAIVVITCWSANKISTAAYLDRFEILGFLFAYLLTLLFLIILPANVIKTFFLGAITVAFLIFNASKTLDHLSYLTKDSYESGANRVLAIKSAASKHDQSWYRINEGLTRTSNDGFLGNFSSGNHFSSLLSSQNSFLYQNLGQIHGDSRIFYSNGSTITDSLLGFKYFVQAKSTAVQSGAQSTVRTDYQQAPTVSQGSDWILKENTSALGLAYAGSTKALTMKYSSNYPLTNQELLLNGLAGHSNKNIIGLADMSVKSLDNLTMTGKIFAGTVAKINNSNPGVLTLTFTPITNDPYYLKIGSYFDLDNVNFSLNGKSFTQSNAGNNTVALNVARNQKGIPQTLTITLLDGASSRFLDGFSLYSYNQDVIDQDLKTLHQHQIKMTKSNSRKIEGTITTTTDQSLIMTSIPSDPGWHAKVDGKRVKTVSVAGGLLAVKTKPGHHHLVLTYTPPLFTLGFSISILTVTSLVLTWYFKKK